MATTSVSPPVAKQMVERCLQLKLVPYIKGSPGVGKSAMMREIAEAYNLKLIDVRLAQCDPTDLMGFPRIEGNKASYVPMSTFPIKGDEIPKGYSGWLLFFDELPLAAQSVQKACYKILLDRMIGDHELHDNVVMACAGNLETDNAMAEEITTAIQSRLIHINMHVCVNSWLDWARTNKIDPRITSYISWKPDILHKFRPDHQDDTFPCPRTWEFAHKHINGKGMLDQIDRSLLAGTISEGVAIEFYGFCQVADQLPPMAEIIKNPTGTPVPREPSVTWMITGSLGAAATEDNITPIMEYVGRLPREFQVLTLKEIVKRTPKLFRAKAVDEWLTVNGHSLF